MKRLLELCDEAGERDGAILRPQVSSRPTTLLIGLSSSHPFSFRPSYQEIAGLPLAERVARLREPSVSRYGLGDRGLLAPGKKGDLNGIDLDRLEAMLPEMMNDLPAGAARFIQRARGYEATVVSGEITFREGEHTGRLPGRLVRGARA